VQAEKMSVSCCRWLIYSGTDLPHGSQLRMAFISTFGARYDGNADLSYQVMTGFEQTVKWYLPTNASDTAAIQAQGGS